MVKTIEGILLEGKIIPLQKVPKRKWRQILITFVEEEVVEVKEGMTLGELKKFSGAIKNLDIGDTVAFQRELRDEW